MPADLTDARRSSPDVIVVGGGIGGLSAALNDWDAALAAYQAVRAEHCRRVVLTARKWGDLWHHDGTMRLQRNSILRARDTDDYSFTDWIYGPTALTPDQEPPLYPDIPLDSVEAEGPGVGRVRSG
jgi:salicylate hydroxylase